MTIRILIAEDQHIIRAGLHKLLENAPSLTIVGEAADGNEVLAQAKALTPDVILLDLVMPHMAGAETVAALHQQNRDSRILILTGFVDNDSAIAAIRAGAAGYLLKTASIEELTQAIHTVHRGEIVLHSVIATRLIHELVNPPTLTEKSNDLTPRQMQILSLVAHGLSNQEIARELSIGEQTVRTHINHILRKLKMVSRTQAALYALKSGLVALEQKPATQTQRFVR